MNQDNRMNNIKIKGDSMKKVIYSVLAITMISTFAFTACGKDDSKTSNNENTTETLVQEQTEEMTEEQVTSVDNKETNEMAENAYMEFLKGNSTITTAELFKEDDNDEYPMDGLNYGTYNYEELKLSIQEFEMCDMTTKYAFVDLGHDGINEMVLRFESKDPSFMNWVGIVAYNGEGLDLNFYYEDGYRCFANLYTSGYLQTGGAMSAAGTTVSWYNFDEQGFGNRVFRLDEYFGTSAVEITYLLSEEGLPINGDYDDIAVLTEMIVSAYVTDEGVKISSSNMSSNEYVKTKEKELVEEIQGLGATLIDDGYMKEMCDMDEFVTDVVEFTEWEDNLANTEAETTDSEAVVEVVEASQDFLGMEGCYDEYIMDDAQSNVPVVISTSKDITNFELYSITIEDATEDGIGIFNAQKIYSQPVLEGARPIVAWVPFIGDTPNIGISYADKCGETHTFAIEMSGYDGSLLLTEAEFR